MDATHVVGLPVSDEELLTVPGRGCVKTRRLPNRRNFLD